MNHTGASSCYVCPAGHYCVNRDRADVCRQGYYCPEGTGADLQPCPTGTFGNTTGLNNETQCTPCTGIYSGIECRNSLIFHKTSFSPSVIGFVSKTSFFQCVVEFFTRLHFRKRNLFITTFNCIYKIIHENFIFSSRCLTNFSQQNVKLYFLIHVNVNFKIKNIIITKSCRLSLKNDLPSRNEFLSMEK